MIQHELNIKIVSTNGQLSIGKKYAGSQVQIIEQDKDTLLIKRGKFIPNNEHWLYENNNLERLEKAIKSMESHERINNSEELLAKFERAIGNDWNIIRYERKIQI